MMHYSLRITHVAKRVSEYVPYMYVLSFSVIFLQTAWKYPQKKKNSNLDSVGDIICQSLLDYQCTWQKTL